MKNFTFLTSLPRTANTVIGSIINSNKNIKATANSILPGIIYDINNMKNTDNFKNFPDHKSLDNISKNVFNNYYKDWNCDYILERGPWGTPKNLENLKQIIPNPKFVFVDRPLDEVIFSIQTIFENNGLTITENQLLDKQGIIGKYQWSIQNIIDNNETYLKLNYDDFLNDQKNFFEKLSEFIGCKIEIPADLVQFNINDIYYDDEAIGLEGLHNVRRNI
tara:strand:+ start:179 stop:838 length:660 start_codon:yes stop_codon:yes gene_type:complete